MPSSSRARATPWTRELARPLPVAAVIVLALNDHVLKDAHLLPGWMTGKLSDLAGLFFFPILLFTLVGGALGAPRSRVGRACLLAGLTLLAFAAIKLVPACNALANHVLGDVVLDRTDLVASPMVIASIVYLRRAPSEARQSRLARLIPGRLAVLFTALASMATSSPKMARNYPAWVIQGNPRQHIGCAVLTVEIVKSGKTGIGAIVTRDEEGACDVRIDAARVRIKDERWPAVAVPAWDGARSMYLGFAFDNEKLWNDALREGTLELDVVTNGVPATLSLPMTHVWTGPHRREERGGPPPPRSTSSMPVAAPPTVTTPAPSTEGGP